MGGRWLDDLAASVRYIKRPGKFLEGLFAAVVEVVVVVVVVVVLMCVGAVREVKRSWRGECRLSFFEWWVSGSSEGGTRAREKGMAG
jgi:hypothetical protein